MSEARLYAKEMENSDQQRCGDMARDLANDARVAYAEILKAAGEKLLRMSRELAPCVLDSSKYQDEAAVIAGMAVEFFRSDGVFEFRVEGAQEHQADWIIEQARDEVFGEMEGMLNE